MSDLAAVTTETQCPPSYLSWLGPLGTHHDIYGFLKALAALASPGNSDSVALRRALVFMFVESSSGSSNEQPPCRELLFCELEIGQHLWCETGQRQPGLSHPTRMRPGQVVRAEGWHSGSCLFRGSPSGFFCLSAPSNSPACAVLVFQLLPTGWMNPRTLSWPLVRMGDSYVEPVGTPSPLSSGW